MANKKIAKAKDSVRNRKKSNATSVQRFMPIAEIKQDVVVLKNGGLRAVLAVGSMNFSLKSEDEQNAIIASYQQFLNTLVFPVQMVVRSTRLNVDAYIKDLNRRSEKQKNPLLKEQTLDYAQFIDRLVDVSDIMQKRFYCVIPVDPPGIVKASFFQKYIGWLAPADTREKAIARKHRFGDMSVTLKERVNVVQAGLENIGVTAERLSTLQLIELYYGVYNPNTSLEQKLPGIDDLGLQSYVL